MSCCSLAAVLSVILFAMCFVFMLHFVYSLGSLWERVGIILDGDVLTHVTRSWPVPSKKDFD